MDGTEVKVNIHQNNRLWTLQTQQEQSLDWKKKLLLYWLHVSLHVLKDSLNETVRGLGRKLYCLHILL